MCSWPATFRHTDETAADTFDHLADEHRDLLSSAPRWTPPPTPADPPDTRAAGIGTGAANAQVLTFRFPARGTGTIVVSAPVTSPTGLNTGGLGGYL